MTYLRVRDGGGEAGKMKNSCRPAGCEERSIWGGGRIGYRLAHSQFYPNFTPVPRYPDIIPIEAALFNLLPTLGRNA